MSPRPKRILFGVSGGIAAYKAPDVLHGWVKLGCEVETILTEAAEQFVSPLALSTLSKRRVWRERDFLSAEYGWQIPHISLTDWADLFVIAPCTANVLRAAAQGDGSTLLGAALLANTKPLLLFPAMNGKMLASDPVRFISNPSSGKMGYAIAEEAWRRGADVTLITGPTALRRPAGIKIVEVTSADEMFDACMEASESADIIVKAAAVGDYRPAERAEQKIKRGGKDTMTLELVQNRDIAAELGRRKRPGQLLVGFAAETQNVLENAQKKMAEKNLDMIVSNDVLAPGAGFAVDTNAVTIMARGAEPVRFSGTKDETASRILDSVSALAAGK